MPARPQVYVRPGETAWVKAPPGVFHLRLAEGRTWFGDEFQFGPSLAQPEGSRAALRAAGAVDAAGVALPAAAAEEPLAMYGTSKWSYAEAWLYRSRARRWAVTAEDPTVALDEFNEHGDYLTAEQQTAHRDLFMKDTGAFRTARGRLDWPVAAGAAGVGASAPPPPPPWEMLKGPPGTEVDDSDEDGDDSSSDEEGPAFSTLWQPFPGLRAAVDGPSSSRAAAGGVVDLAALPGGVLAAGAGTYSPISGRPARSLDDATGGGGGGGGGDWGPLGPAGFELSGLPLVVGGRGTFLRVAAKPEPDPVSRRISVESLSGGGASSLRRPLLIHGAPCYK